MTGNGNGTLLLLCVLQTEFRTTYSNWFVDVYYERRPTQRLDHECYLATVEYLVCVGGIWKKNSIVGILEEMPMRVWGVMELMLVL